MLRFGHRLAISSQTHSRREGTDLAAAIADRALLRVGIFAAILHNSHRARKGTDTASGTPVWLRSVKAHPPATGSEPRGVPLAAVGRCRAGITSGGSRRMMEPGPTFAAGCPALARGATSRGLSGSLCSEAVRQSDSRQQSHSVGVVGSGGKPIQQARPPAGYRCAT